MHKNVIGKEVLDAAVQVHREPGPGLLEMVYEMVLRREVELPGLRVERQVPVDLCVRKQFRPTKMDAPIPAMTLPGRRVGDPRRSAKPV
jgi:GxxExxY protein